MVLQRTKSYLGTIKPLITLLLMFAVAAPVIATPPDWAPAHGYRNKHKHKQYRHYDDDEQYEYYEDDGGGNDIVINLPWHSDTHDNEYVTEGFCHKDKVGAVLGGVVGGVAGARITRDSRGRHKTAATIAGTVIGVLVGQSIGREMDAADQNCTGQTLEHANDHESIRWKDAESGDRYAVTPTHTYQTSGGRYCRDYLTDAIIDGRKQQVHGQACRQPDGTWQSI